ncbi:hypothetical protein RND81_03G068500 [Saponaria officinalis]|uniref:AIPP2-like SPOC-like domain-containing protein n=1 Tax=Saponaria officinalis TaxID=3572 RepID=A0AAW1LYS8_SAPOF
MTVCQACGDAGWVETLIFCCKCQGIAEHTYCLDQSTTTDDGCIRWVCEFCEPRVIELSDSTRQSSEGSLLSLKELRGVEGSEQPRNALNPKESLYIRPGNNGQTRCRDSVNKHYDRKYIVEDIRFLSKDSTDNLAEAFSSTVLPRSQETSEITVSDFLDTAQPLSYSIWRGRCCIYGQYSFTILAHMSSKASAEASEVVRSLPKLLGFEIVPKIDIWPLKFRNAVPTADNISVYFFPEDYRAERVYDRLVDYIIEHEFAMLLKVHNVELLVFSSRELHLNNWRYQRKYYLWGIIRRKKKNLPQNQSDNHTSS